MRLSNCLNMQVRLLILNKAQLTQLTCEAIVGFTQHIKMSTTLIQTLFFLSSPDFWGITPQSFYCQFQSFCRTSSPFCFLTFKIGNSEVFGLTILPYHQLELVWCSGENAVLETRRLTSSPILGMNTRWGTLDNFLFLAQPTSQNCNSGEGKKRERNIRYDCPLELYIKKGKIKI